MDFKTATDRLTECPSLADVAAELGVAHNSVLRARMEGPNARPAPGGWEKAIAELARRRARALEELAAELVGE